MSASSTAPMSTPAAAPATTSSGLCAPRYTRAKHTNAAIPIGTHRQPRGK
jgi:hypothetical protein